MLLKCCLLYVDMTLPRLAVLCILVTMSTFRSIKSFDIFFIIIFIFIAINLRHTCLFRHFCQKFCVTVLLSFSLIFSQFQPGVAYKSVAYKKACISTEKDLRSSKYIILYVFYLPSPLSLDMLYDSKNEKDWQ